MKYIELFKIDINKLEMVNWNLSLSLLVSVIVLSGCLQTTSTTENVVCNTPYIRYAGRCCLDHNGNGICDNDETTTMPPTTTLLPTTSTTLKPSGVTTTSATTVTSTSTVTTVASEPTTTVTIASPTTLELTTTTSTTITTSTSSTTTTTTLSGSCTAGEVGDKRCYFFDAQHGGPATWIQECKANKAWTNTVACTNTCVNGMCITGLVTPKIYHKECVAGSCVSVFGAGADTCTTNLNCKTLGTIRTLTTIPITIPVTIPHY